MDAGTGLFHNWTERLNFVDFREKKINSGTFSVCYKCLHKKTMTEFAVKIMNITQRDPIDEIEIILRHSHHPNIVGCRDVRTSFLLKSQS